MSIFSGTFACFILILGFLYFVVPKKLQWIILLTGSLVFYAWSGYRYLVYVLSCTFFTWFAALQIEKINTGLRQKLPEVSGKEEKTALRKAAGKRIPSAIISAARKSSPRRSGKALLMRTPLTPVIRLSRLSFTTTAHTAMSRILR